MGAESPVNYQKEMERIIRLHEEKGEVLQLLLHSCCGPCSTSVIEQLSEYFRIQVFYYNPCIGPEEEYLLRKREQKRFLTEYRGEHPVILQEAPYDSEQFYEAVKGLESAEESGERCRICFEQRLRKTAEWAAAYSYPYFTTTLSVSPHKNARQINEIGQRLAKEYEGAGIRWLPSDFKKKNGYFRSVELTRQYGLYRQDYCGCIFSKRRIGN